MSSHSSLSNETAPPLPPRTNTNSSMFSGPGAPITTSGVVDRNPPPQRQHDLLNDEDDELDGDHAEHEHSEARRSALDRYKPLVPS